MAFMVVSLGCAASPKIHDNFEKKSFITAEHLYQQPFNFYCIEVKAESSETRLNDSRLSAWLKENKVPI